MKRILLLIVVALITITSQAATVTFTKIFPGSLNNNKLSITTPVGGNAYSFISANPDLPAFSGNNIGGTLNFTVNGMKNTIVGWINLRVGNTEAVVFEETTVLGGTTTTGRLWLLVFPAYVANFTNNQTAISCNSAGVGTALEALRVQEANNNNIPVITSNGGGLSAFIGINEGLTAVTIVTSSDPLKGTQISETANYSISGGADAAKFSINPTTGVLTFISAPDYENPTDAGLNNVYDVQVTVTDSQGAADVQNIEVTIIDLNDNTPVITSNGGGATAAIAVTQGTTAVTTVTATDADYGDAITYSIESGGNSSLFIINSATGALSFVSNAVVGTYPITVRATDSQGHYDSQIITVNVTTSDVTRPTVQITSSDNNLSAGETCTINFLFSEAVQGFSLSDISTEGGNISNLTSNPENPMLFSALFTQSGSAYAPKITISDNVYSDLNANFGYGNSLTLAYDVNPPTVTVVFTSADISFGETEVVTFNFSENPGTSFTASDITVTNADLLALVATADPKVWQATIKQTSALSAPVVTVQNLSYTDPAGNRGSSASATISLVPPTIDLANTPVSDTGTSSTDNITNNRKPVITGLVGSGVATVTVNVEYYVSGSPVTITYSNVAVSSLVYSLDLASVSPSAGSMPAEGLPAGYVSLKVTTPTNATATNQFLIDLTSPSIPEVKPNPQTTFDATPSITGTATIADGDILTVTVNNVTYINGDGSLNLIGSDWTLLIPTANKLSPATYPVTACITDLAGNYKNDLTTNELVISPSTVSIYLNTLAADDTGSSSTDHITTNRKPIIKGTSVGTDTSVKITVVSDGYAYTYNSVAVVGGVFSLDLASVNPSSVVPTGNFPAAGLPEGSVSLIVEGNTSGAIGTSGFVIDLTDPVSPTVNSDTTNDTTPVITGSATVNAGEILKVTINGITYTNGDGKLSFSSGVWTLNIPTGNALLANHSYPVTVSVTDPAGNSATGSGTIVITNATVSVDLANTPESDTGTSSTDNVTTNRKPVIVGTASSDAVVTVTIQSGGVTYTFGNVAVTAGNWSLNLSTAATISGTAFPTAGLSEGTIYLQVTGNTTSATEVSTFELNYISTTVADGTWTTTTKWDTEDKPNSEIAQAILKHKMTIPESENIVCKDVTVDPLASLTNNSSLTIKENFILKVSNDNKSSSVINNGTVTNQGRIIIRKSFSRDFGWYFMSFPFNVPADKIFIAGTNTVARWGDPTKAGTSTADFYVSEYDGAKRDATGIVDYVSNSPNWKDVDPHVFVAKKGYIVAVPGDIEIDFVSSQGDVSIFNPNSSVTVQKFTNNKYTYHNSWNLIGIPYAASYKLNTATQAPFYSYNKTQSNYDVVMTSDDDYLINPYYSFFMQANGSTIDFSSTGRLAVKSKLIAPSYSEVNLVLKNATYTDKTRIRLDEGADPNYVIGSDAVKMFSDVSAVPQIYTFIGTYPIAYNTLPATTSAVDVATKIGVKGNYSIVLTKAMKAQGFSKITLVDNLLNKQQDLLTDSVYNFSSDPGTSKRFRIMFSNSVTTDVAVGSENNISAIAINKTVRIHGLENPATVNVYSVSGELLTNFAHVNNDDILHVDYKGMIVLRIEQEKMINVIKLNI